MLIAEETFLAELLIIEELLGHRHPRYCHHRPRPHGEIWFEFHFNNLSILQPMQVSKVIGPFTGKLVFKNAEGQEQPFSGLTNVALTGSDPAIGTVSLNPDGTFAGTGLAAGDFVLTVTGTNDAGNQVTGSSTISFHADTTVTSAEPVID